MITTDTPFHRSAYNEAKQVFDVERESFSTNASKHVLIPNEKIILKKYIGF